MSDATDYVQISKEACFRFAVASGALRIEYAECERPAERWLISYEAEALLYTVLTEARKLVDIVSGRDDGDEDGWQSGIALPYGVERVERYALALYRDLRRARLARELAQVIAEEPQEFGA